MVVITLILKGTSDLNSTMFSFIYFPSIRNFTQMGWFHIVMGWGSKSCFFFHRRRHDCLGFGGLEFLVNGKIWNVVVTQAVDGHCPERKRAVQSRDTLLIGINATPASTQKWTNTTTPLGPVRYPCGAGGPASAGWNSSTP